MLDKTLNNPQYLDVRHKSIPHISLGLPSPPLLIVLPDIAVGFLEQLLIRMQFVLEKCLAQRLFDLALASLRALPTRKTHQSNNLIDVRDDTLDHDRRLSGFYLIEQDRKSVV